MILAILQARASSTRLPGKVLKPILGRPMLARQIERVCRARRIDRLVVATSTDASDDAVAALCHHIGVARFRGSLDDVLDRFYKAAVPYSPAHVVRLTGDCPLADPQLIDRLIAFHLDGGFDYSSNALEPSYADGLDAEIMTFGALGEAWHEARLASEREHVTPFIHKRPERYRIGSMSGDRDLSALRWCVDEPEDLEVVRSIYGALYPANPNFTTADILDYLSRHGDVAGHNAGLVRNQGYAASLVDDKLAAAAKG